eukprot:6477157-Ditylum_brightwellii.AAC.1
MRFGEGDTGGWMEKQDGWKTYEKKDGKGDGTDWNSPIHHMEDSNVGGVTVGLYAVRFPIKYSNKGNRM